MATAVSTVPACLDALVGAVRVALPGVQVIDGQPTTEVERDVVCIGFTGQPGEAAVTSTLTREVYARSPDREQYDISCLASSWRGDVDPKAVRDRSFELLDAVAEVLAADQTLGGAVLRARLSADVIGQEQTTEGAVCTVGFTIHTDAFTR
jgi:hypothetical protein